MTQTRIHRFFAPIKSALPSWCSNLIRNTATSILVPLHYSYRTGHFRSCFKMAAVSKDGEPIPWYTYPCIDFLKFRDYTSLTVLEFGSGQSTLWWARRAKKVMALEGDQQWYDKMKSKVPDNVQLELVSMKDRQTNVRTVAEALGKSDQSSFDIIVIDGLFREDMIDFAKGLRSEQGMIICDNAEGYGIYEGFKDSGLLRVDFFGNAPGVLLPHATSIFFASSNFAFDSKLPIPVVAKEA